MIRDRLVVVALGASLAGCLGPVTISPPSAGTTPLPEQGPNVSVTVSDERSEKSRSRVGILLGIGRDFVLESDASLATRLEDELVTALRTRGYRADHARDANVALDVSLVVRVVRFAADVHALTKVRFEGRSVLVAHATTSDAPGSVWTEVIDTREEVALGGFTGLEALRTLIEGFFQKVAAGLTDRVSTGLPPPRGRS